MTDDLVKQLRDLADRFGRCRVRDAVQESADRIEALTAENDRLQSVVDKCESIAKDTVSMCNEGVSVRAKNVAQAFLRILKTEEKPND